MGLFKKLFGSQEADWQTTTVKTDTVFAQTDPVVQTNKAVLTGNEAREAVENIERAMNMDLDGDGKVGGVQTPGAQTPWSVFQSSMAQGPAAAGTDTVSQLERLAKLHESGALTDAEFAAQKAKLIGS
jgi:hypothetical protein